jgi:putative membrane protein
VSIVFFQFGFYLFAGLAALLHVYIWTMESLTWRKPATWKRFGVSSQEEAETQAMFAFNQGFYNLFLAVIAGLGMAHVACGRHVEAGWALVLAATASMLGAALVLRSCGKEYTRAAVLQGTFPLLAIVCALTILNAT